jgi:integrase
MQAKLTQAFIDKAKAERGSERTIHWDKGLPGFGLMVTAKGHKSFVFQYRVGTTSRRLKLDGEFLRHEATREGAATAVTVAKSGAFTLADARQEAKAVQGAASRGRDPLTELRKVRTADSNTLKAIAEDYLSRETQKLRSIDQRKSTFERLIYPRLGSRPIETIKRSEIVKLLDKVEEENGPVASQHTLAVLRRFFNWHAARDDDFLNPIVKGMARINPKERERDRILTDPEIRAAWRAAGDSGTAYGHLLRVIMLTATRLRETAWAARGEVQSGGAELLIPASRHKSKREFLLPLSGLAQAEIAKVPVIGRKWIFTTNGTAPISGFSKFKAAFDKAMLAELRKENPKAELPDWTTHDLRRTARSIMSRAGVDPDHAERAIGHVISGIRGTYDRHEFVEEKRAAFEALATHIGLILNPTANVVRLSA